MSNFITILYPLRMMYDSTRKRFVLFSEFYENMFLLPGEKSKFEKLRCPSPFDACISALYFRVHSKPTEKHSTSFDGIIPSKVSREDDILRTHPCQSPSKVASSRMWNTGLFFTA